MIKIKTYKMEAHYNHHQQRLKATKKVDEIKGFYTHLIATFFIPPFLVFINLKTAPQFQWFWYAIAAWLIGLVIHWFNVFGSSKFLRKWEENKINETFKESKNKSAFVQEQYFIRTKKKVKEIKGFYIHLFISVIAIAIIVTVNLQFVPGFHFFWFAAGGMFLGLFFHWLGVFGFNKMGLGKQWEEKKIKEFMNQENN